MTKHQKVNPLDQAIQKWAEVFGGIEGFGSQDEDVRYASTFIATKLFNLEQSRQLTINNFVPSVNKTISDTKGYLTTSQYKLAIKTMVDDNLQVLKEDTIRLGYVMLFHKYENFVKDYIVYIEKRSESYTVDTGETLLEFCKSRFGFNPSSWWKYPVVHKVNFISNCTKHHDGKCKLDNPKHTKPSMYAHLPNSEIIKPDLNQFKEDTSLLIQSIANYLIIILENANMIRSFQSVLQSHNSLTAVYREALSINEGALIKTFTFEGIEHPVLTDSDLQHYNDENKRYKEGIEEHEQKAQSYRSKVIAAEETIKSHIRGYESEIS